ncbi:MAG: hypothetical protein ABIH37_00775 [archaeon]
MLLDERKVTRLDKNRIEYTIYDGDYGTHHILERVSDGSWVHSSREGTDTRYYPDSVGIGTYDKILIDRLEKRTGVA